MFTDSYTQIEHGAAAKILDDLNPHLDGAPFDASIARVLTHDLPFYEGYQLVEVSDYDLNPPRQISFIYNDINNEVLILNGLNEVIYNINKKSALKLDKELVTLYVQFFFSYVRGRHGRFIIIENVDDIDWRDEPSPAGRKALAKMVKPISFKQESDEEFLLNASIIFKNSLFESDINVKKDGTVSLNNQELLVEDIPVLDDAFGQ